MKAGDVVRIKSDVGFWMYPDVYEEWPPDGHDAVDVYNDVVILILEEKVFNPYGDRSHRLLRCLLPSGVIGWVNRNDWSNDWNVNIEVIG